MTGQIQITPEMRAVVDVPSPPWRFEVTATSVRAFARGVGYADPVYFDEDVARAAGHRALPAPPTYLGTPVFVPGHSHDLLPVPPGRALELDFGLTRLLDGGSAIEYERTVYAGDVLTAVNRITGIEPKTSRSLGAMLVVRAESEFRDPGGRLVATERLHLIRY